MASVKYIASKKSRALEALKSISKLFRSDCASGQEFAEALESSPSTAWRRLKAPDELTLDELITASINLGYGGSIRLHNKEISVEVNW